MGRISIFRIDATSENYPPECMVCGIQEATHQEPRKMTFHPTWSFLVGGVVLAYFMRKEAVVNLRFCDECHEKHRRLPQFGCLVAFVAVAMFFGMIYAFVERQEALGVLMLIAMIVGVIVYVVAYNNKYAITIAEIDDYKIVLNVPKSPYPQKYREYMNLLQSSHGQWAGQSTGGFNGQPGYGNQGSYGQQAQPGRGQGSHQPMYHPGSGHPGCPNCGFSNIEESNFCAKCGNYL